ncbi:AraC family transcriptional regulator [Pedobacter sp.]|jgi:AraC-like DNA-binding protein|uniref:helix-turn-helix domain-containing protein n=1 Tax=Pedobacter sp. TaxID=1411316 RepID=UPI002D16B4D7|nr:AraC family transcriptional regulator [Pedobacter sp.]HWW42759.1 AraC family transcriptional regulator [Pedobacter sp.]
MQNKNIEYKSIKPNQELQDFVESFWMLANLSEEREEVVVLPDGRIDVLFSISATEPYHVTLMGLDVAANKGILLPGEKIYALSFRLLAVEYILDLHLSELLGHVLVLPENFLGISAIDLNSFTGFCYRVSEQLLQKLKKPVKEKKRKLFELIYSSNGSMTVKELSEKANWSSRQINRYFNDRFGLSLKTYCNILRFRASFQQIKDGILYPQQDFSDQAHFIREVKRYSGVIPKELNENKNDRFIQFSTLLKK